MATINLAVMMVVMAALCEISLGTNYIVGDSVGWVSNTACNYMTWAGNKIFYVGDTLEFDYDARFYNVLEVTKTDYDSCNLGTPIGSYNTGKDVVPLTSRGEHYFVCSYTCMTGNMQFFVTVQGSEPHQLPPPSPSARYPPDCIDTTTHTPIAGCIPTWVPVPYNNGTNPDEKSRNTASVVSPVWLSLSLVLTGAFAMVIA